jgi:hypothetical protein
MGLIHEAEKKLAFADFLVGRADMDNYAKAAFGHVFASANILIQSLTGLNDLDSNSPQLVKQNLVKFNDPEATDFAKFYVELLKATSKQNVTVGEVEISVRRVRQFLEWVQDQKVQ